MFKTIVALATPPLKSALAIIRVSGNDAFNIVSKIFSKDISLIEKRTTLIGKIVKNNEIIDDVVLIAYKGPKSFTGEDLVEIICHGSMLIVNQIIEALLSEGARMATNGEYSSRAFLHKKIDLIQAEAINDLINATTKESKNISMMSLEGRVSEQITPLKTKIADILSLIEVNIDFPEYEDIEVANKEMIISSVDDIVLKLEPLLNNAKKAKIIKDGIKVAIVGKPNVGKSSLLNALLGEEKAIVTEIAGTTRDIVEGDINLNGITLHLLDTAGIRDTKDSIENIGVGKSKKALEEAELVIVVLDGSQKIDGQDEEILELTKNLNRIIVYNKSDLNKSEQLSISAKNKDLKPLIDEIYKYLGLDKQSFKTPALNNTRQIGLLEKAKTSLLKARSDAANNLTVDLISVSLMEAYNNILEILGEINQNDLSKEIFSRFCVGK